MKINDVIAATVASGVVSFPFRTGLLSMDSNFAGRVTASGAIGAFGPEATSRAIQQRGIRAVLHNPCYQDTATQLIIPMDAAMPCWV
jgi:hypothetical protein